jgi:hypothetical protein
MPSRYEGALCDSWALRFRLWRWRDARRYEKHRGWAATRSQISGEHLFFSDVMIVPKHSVWDKFAFGFEQDAAPYGFDAVDRKYGLDWS